jgi:hypothetical protein
MLLLGEILEDVGLDDCSISSLCRGSCARQAEASEDENRKGMTLPLSAVSSIHGIVLYSTSNIVSV